MRIIIVGCGKVGRTISEQLDGEGHNITVVDTNSASVDRVTDHLDVMGIEGDGASREVLSEAGVENAELVIAVTDADELNIYICLLAHILGAANTIARVRKPVYSNDISENRELSKAIGLSLMINPEKIAAYEISRLVRFPAAIEVDSFARGNAELYTLKLPEKHPIIGKKIREVDTFKADLFRSAARLCIVQRGSEVYIPDGNFICAAGDKVSLICTPSKADNMFKKFNGGAAGGARNVMIIGGSRTAYYLAQILLDSNCNVKLIEKDAKRANELSNLLPRANVINEDALNEDMLMREGLEKMEAVVTLTNLDEENIMLSLYVRQNTKAKCITKVERIVFDKIVDTLPLDSVIRPRELTAEAIVRYVRAVKNSEGSNVESLYKLCDGKVEALEFRVTSKDTRIIGHQLQMMNFKNNLQVVCVKRRSKVIIPKGQDTIEPEDFVVVVTTQKGLQRIEDILAD